MSAEPVPPGPIDCMRRGLASLRANWQLVPALVAQSLLTTGLVVAGALILFAGLGVSLVAWLRDLDPEWPQQLAYDLSAAVEAGLPPLLSLVAPLLAALVVWTLAFGLYCYLQGGIVGVLAEAEMAAGTGRPGWRAFRRFTPGEFDIRGRRLFWRYFWFNHVLGGVLLIWSTLLLGLVAVVANLTAGPHLEAGVALGCLGLVPLAVALVAAGLWSMLATVEIARPGAGVWVASRRALGALRRRLGAVLVLWLLALAGWMIVGAAFAPLKWALVIAAGDRLSHWLAGRGALMLLEAVAHGALLVALVAALSALVGLRSASAESAA